MTLDEAAIFMSALFEQSGIKPHRAGTTADNSVLFQFLGGNKACVDIYPSGVVAVIIRKAGVDELYELELDDSELILSLLRDAGVRA